MEVYGVEIEVFYEGSNIIALFSNNDDAEFLADKLNENFKRNHNNCCNASVCDFIIDEYPLDNLKRGLILFDIGMWKDGRVYKVNEDENFNEDNRFNIDKPKNRPGWVNVIASVWAKNKEDAIEIVDKYRLEAIENGEL